MDEDRPTDGPMGALRKRLGREGFRWHPAGVKRWRLRLGMCAADWGRGVVFSALYILRYEPGRPLMFVKGYISPLREDERP